jgi:hypothetical protein
VLALLTHVQDEVLLLRPLHIGLAADRISQHSLNTLLSLVVLAVVVLVATQQVLVVVALVVHAQATLILLEVKH